MEDVQFQYRPSNCASNHSRYPLTFNQRVAQGDLYREAAERLKASLRSIEDLYASTHVEGHSGSSECELCAEKGRRVKQVYYDYYLGNQPGRWDEGLVNYREDLEALFSRSDFPLDAIHARFKRELKDHFRRDMYTVLPTDAPELAEQKTRLDHYFRDTPIEVALEKCFHDKITSLAAVPGSDGEVSRANILDPTHPAGLFIALQKAQTTDQRGHLYSAYYCSSVPSDTPQQRNLKAKYAKLFESGTSHDAVLEMWRSEAKELKARDVEQLEQRLVELKMAQNAHLKNMKKKMMKEDAKLMDKKDMVECSLPSCNNQMDKSKGGVDECGLCLWLSRKSRERRRFFYCSEDHCEEHFQDGHPQQEHSCTMGNHCYYSRSGGCPQLDASGLCKDCLKNEVLSFFCSSECYAHNLAMHRGEEHNHLPSESLTDQLVIFQPEPDFELKRP